jgi:hypothetical protein
VSPQAPALKRIAIITINLLADMDASQWNCAVMNPEHCRLAPGLSKGQDEDSRFG